jgi:hypothetical protein
MGEPWLMKRTAQQRHGLEPRQFARKSRSASIAVGGSPVKAFAKGGKVNKPEKVEPKMGKLPDTHEFGSAGEPTMDAVPIVRDPRPEPAKGKGYADGGKVRADRAFGRG